MTSKRCCNLWLFKALQAWRPTFTTRAFSTALQIRVRRAPVVPNAQQVFLTSPRCERGNEAVDLVRELGVRGDHRAHLAARVEHRAVIPAAEHAPDFHQREVGEL